MSSDSNRMTDETRVQIVGEIAGYPTQSTIEGETVSAEPLPDRPADGAQKAKWVDYVVALGADRDYVTGDTDHWDDDDPEPRYVTRPGLSVAELRDLADRLGG